MDTLERFCFEWVLQDLGLDESRIFTFLPNASCASDSTARGLVWEWLCNPISFPLHKGYCFYVNPVKNKSPSFINTNFVPIILFSLMIKIHKDNIIIMQRLIHCLGRKMLFGLLGCKYILDNSFLLPTQFIFLIFAGPFFHVNST